MKTHKSIFIAVILLILQSSVYSQQNTTYIHGYKSNPGIWYDLHNYINSIYRLSKSNDIQLSSTTNISSQAQELNGKLGSSQYLAIAHSMGGVVSRELIRQNNSTKINKLITIGSPHRGAVIVNRIQSGFLTYASQAIINDLTLGPGGGVWYIQAIKDVALMTGGQFFQGYLNMQVNDAASQDIKDGSNFLSTLNSSSTLSNENFLRAGIWGDENSVRPIRLAASSTSTDKSDGHQNTYVNYYNAVRNVYQAVAYVYYWYAIQYMWAYYDTGYLGYYFAAMQAYYNGDRWYQGYAGLKYYFPDDWDYATGSIYQNSYGHWKWEPSDAFINKSSQLFPNNNTTNWKGNHRADNVGHLQETTHQKVRDKLNMLYGPTYFNVPKK